MQNRSERLGAQPHQRGLLRKSNTYLAKVAVMLQDAPGKMLTFSQLMDKLAPHFSEDKKSVENNIRVCLSTNKCFVKIPMAQDSTESKRNYWKLDCSQITAKMVRRHFKGILQLFPELVSKVETENMSSPSRPCSAEAAACRAVRISRAVKFSGPFSIESLLKRDSPISRRYRACPLSSLQVRAENPMQLTNGPVWDCEEPRFCQASAACSQICSTGGSTHHGLTGGGAAVHIGGLHVCSEPPVPVSACAAPYFSSQHNSCITYSVPAFRL